MPAIPSLSLFDVAFVAAALLLIHLARRWMPLYAVLVLPGTALHEACHWCVALLLGGRPTRLSVVPRRSERGWCLGSVAIRRVRWSNALPIGLAPLTLLPLAGWLGWQAIAMDDGWWLRWVWLYVATIAAVSCIPSRADWAIVFSKPLGVAAYLAVGLAALWFFHGETAFW